MALTLSSVQCGCGKQLRTLTIFGCRSGHRNPLFRRMRFTSFFFNISRLCSRSKHEFADKLLDELVDVQSISDRSRLLNKVSVIMGNSGVHDLILNGKADKQNGWDHKDATDHFDASLARKRFPSITLGTSARVDLYDETGQVSEIKSLLSAEGHKGFSSDALPFYVENMALELQEDLDYKKVTVDKSLTNVKLEPPLVDSFLDMPISGLPGLSKRNCNQLENCGFHTLRKLLHHFPRTYADLQNAQVGIDDGQYLISVGRVLSSRAIKASYSLSVLEVVVGSEVVHDKSRHTIYLHLKKFFRGSRFTYQPFLKTLQSKHNCGDIVCVSGKVRTMPAKDHYEMREYNIDVLKDDDNPALHPEGRPYPIYPSKGGLNPNFLRDIIARAVLALAVDIDPIPKGIREEFRLLHLHDAYTAIHKPKSAEEADLARRRFIFDEFFYLQLGRLFQMLEGLDTRTEKEGLLDKYRKPVLNSLYVEDWSSLTKKFLEALPYSLTSSQLTAVSEILWDLKRAVPMNRLLQGDVGCGKTIVAFLACMEVIGSGYQAAFMVPTELLAVQHYEHLLKLLETMKDDQLKPSIALLTGSTPMKQARMIRKDLQNGDISMVIGTHSLISDNVEFSALRIAVVDEQHRFGVIQRGRFNSKVVYYLFASCDDALWNI